MATAWFSIIQYMPSSLRCETLNIGVVLICPERDYLETLTEINFEKVTRVFPKIDRDKERYELMAKSFEHRLRIEREELKDLTNFDHFVATRCNAVRLTPRRWCAIGEDTQAEHRKMFAELVTD